MKKRKYEKFLIIIYMISIRLDKNEISDLSFQGFYPTYRERRKMVSRRRCDIGKIDVHLPSYAKDLRSK